MWNEFLNESRSEHKFQNTPLIVLGNRHSGKRSLIQSLLDTSKTTVHNKRLSTHSQVNKLRLKGLTTAIDYAYLNVIDLNDPDYRTHTKLQVYLIQDTQAPSIYKQLSNPKILKNALILVMLDFTNPWNFMSELEKWVKFIYQLQKNAGFTISQLDAMAQKVQNYYRSFKQPQFDEYGKLKRNFEYEKQQQKIIIPIPEGVLKSNLRLPFIVCANKCDLQSAVLRDQSANKIMFIIYQLRKFCQQYGGTLIYTSIRNNSNLTVLYEYILHRIYNMPLRFKAQSVSQQAIFIPFGFDNPNILHDFKMNMDVNKSYEDFIVAPVQKKNIKEEIIIQEDSKFFQKYVSTVISTSSTVDNTNKNSQISVKDEKSETSQKKPRDYFKALLNKGKEVTTTTNDGLKPQQKQKRSQAQKLLYQHASQIIDKKKQQGKQ